jgi:hypothetical protein
LNPWRCQREKRLWLDNEQGLFPHPNRPSQQHQEHPVRFGTGWSFHPSTKNNELLWEEGIFCHEFGLAAGKICQRPHQERGGGGRFGPVYEAMVKRLKAKACQPFDEEKNPMHSVGYPFEDE